MTLLAWSLTSKKLSFRLQQVQWYLLLLFLCPLVVDNFMFKMYWFVLCLALYKYMGRYEPKERKNRGKVTKILWGDTIMIVLVCKMRGWWGGLLRRGGVQEASFSHARVTRAHSLQTCTFCFHNLHARRHYSLLSFLMLRFFQCSMRTFLRAFFGLFSPSWDGI